MPAAKFLPLAEVVALLLLAAAMRTTSCDEPPGALGDRAGEATRNYYAAQIKHNRAFRTTPPRRASSTECAR
jgi:hypothetical protein